MDQITRNGSNVKSAGCGPQIAGCRFTGCKLWGCIIHTWNNIDNVHKQSILKRLVLQKLIVMINGTGVFLVSGGIIALILRGKNHGTYLIQVYLIPNPNICFDLSDLKVGKVGLKNKSYKGKIIELTCIIWYNNIFYAYQ